MRPLSRSKRVFDVTVAGVVTVVTLPLLGAAALAVRLSMGSPVLFRQVRPGYLGRPFTVFKLRTMLDAAPGTVPGAQSDAERLTRLGRFLRASSLDELPQLWNVLRGDMSLVGPRPLLMQYLPLYTPEQARRHEVRPGITGWAQVNGRNAASWDERFALDTWYVDHQSFWLDLKILARTVTGVLSRRGVSQPGHATVEYFRGSGEHT
jgi:sugar transferase EpsL